MSKLLVVFECYIRLIAHDVFMRKHDLAALHQQIKNFPRRVPRQTNTEAELACHALDIACVLYPKRALCLQRSSVLVKILRRRGVPAHMVIGAQKLPFKAHAWVEVDGEIVNDRLASREKFLVLEVC
jgi:Transglutaminase-like superfamily